MLRFKNMLRHYILSRYHELMFNSLEDGPGFVADATYNNHIHMYLHHGSMYEKYRKGEL